MRNRISGIYKRRSVVLPLSLSLVLISSNLVLHMLLLCPSRPVKIVPLLLGPFNLLKQKEYADYFIPLLKDPMNVFIFSSDFCHWGRRFDYCYRTGSDRYPYQSIQTLDERAMAILSSGSLDAWKAYLKKDSNTICGRFPLTLLLAIIERLNARNQASLSKPNAPLQLVFDHYERSSNPMTDEDSSVSYVAGHLEML